MMCYGFNRVDNIFINLQLLMDKKKEEGEGFSWRGMRGMLVELGSKLSREGIGFKRSLILASSLDIKEKLELSLEIIIRFELSFEL
jgi:hypothetical protein